MLTVFEISPFSWARVLLEKGWGVSQYFTSLSVGKIMANSLKLGRTSSEVEALQHEKGSVTYEIICYLTYVYTIPETKAHWFQTGLQREA